jgi:YHS domain-containing protein
MNYSPAVFSFEVRIRLRVFADDGNRRLTQWAIHHDPAGKLYYFNSVTNQSSWEKPEELMSALERAMGYSDWKEFTQKDTGKKYYYNSKTKETTWKLPKEFDGMYCQGFNSIVITQ